MRPKTLCKLSLLLLALVVPLAWAQKSDSPKYDLSTEFKLKGAVEEVRTVPAVKGEASLELLVKTGSETFQVRLCPERVLKEFEVEFAKGDQVEITGARIKVEDKEIVLAREVVSGNSTLVLRDKRGAPVWTFLKPDAPAVGR